MNRIESNQSSSPSYIFYYNLGLAPVHARLLLFLLLLLKLLALLASLEGLYVALIVGSNPISDGRKGTRFEYGRVSRSVGVLQEPGRQTVVVIPLFHSIVLCRKRQVFLSIGNQKVFQFWISLPGKLFTRMGLLLVFFGGLFLRSGALSSTCSRIVVHSSSSSGSMARWFEIGTGNNSMRNRRRRRNSSMIIDFSIHVQQHGRQFHRKVLLAVVVVNDIHVAVAVAVVVAAIHAVTADVAFGKGEYGTGMIWNGCDNRSGHCGCHPNDVVLLPVFLLLLLLLLLLTMLLKQQRMTETGLMMAVVVVHHK